VPDNQTHQYGIVGRGKDVGSGFEITKMVEKPPQGTAPSNLAISGRYILEPEIFEILRTQPRGAGGEIQLTDAMITLAKTRPFYGVTFDGQIHDCGSKIGFLVANLAYALARHDIAPALREELKKYI
jgi:UTP--glucose-1-phosphate uridylyltransferase